MEPYKTYQDLMAKKAKEKGIPISEITNHFQRKLSQIYEENPHCVEAWALGRAEYFVWKQFFPSDSWPGAPTKTMQSPLSTEALGSESGEIVESPDKKDQPSLPSRPKPTFSIKIEEALLNAAGSPTILAVYKEVLKNMKERYPRESSEWQEWMSGSKVWVSNFRQHGTFPCNEPHRSYDLLSSDANQLYPRRRGEETSRIGRFGSSWRAEDEPGRRRSRSPPTGPRGGVEFLQRGTIETTRQGGTTGRRELSKPGGTIKREEPLPPSQPLAYGPKEQEMERKAKNMGGEHFRHVFFRALQKSRDAVREIYPDCDRSLKHWLADRMTWERVFANEPFPWLNGRPPGRLDGTPSGDRTGNLSIAPPPGQIVTSRPNNQATAAAGNKPLVLLQRDGNRPQHIPRGPSRGSFQGKKNLFDQTAISDHVASLGSSPERLKKFPATLSNKGAVDAVGDKHLENKEDLVEGTREVAIRKNTVFRALLGDWDDSFKSVQRALGVTIEYNDDASEHLKLIIEPYKPGDNAALERAHRFFEIWKRLIYSDQLIKLDHFWAQYKNHDRTTAFNCQPTIHVNGKKILCPGKFGDLCEFFSQQIQTYQSAMAGHTHTESALPCSALFEAKPYNIYLSSYPLPILLEVDANTRNRILDEHDSFLEEWVRSSMETPISLSDMNNVYAKRRDQERMEMDLDELLKEGAAKASQKRKSETEDSGFNGRKKLCL